jgi:pimeloyl-ACP methyl ester carboxylesterase
MRQWIRTALLLGLAACRSLAWSAEPAAADDGFWKTFHHASMAVNGVRLHYVEGGSGAPILLLPGWPESWYAWRRIMPALVASGHRVIALDPRGMGDSDRPQSGYDMKTVVAEIHAFVARLDLADKGTLDVAGHDLGTWMGYAYAADFPRDVRRLALYDALIPGVSQGAPGITSAEANIKTWHFGFFRLDDLPETLLQGREQAFLAWWFRSKSYKAWTIDAQDMQEYVRIFSAPGAARAGFDYFRAGLSPDGLAQSSARAQNKLAMPVLAVGGEGGVGTALLETMRRVANQAQGGMKAGCGHYILEECTSEVTQDLVRFFALP